MVTMNCPRRLNEFGPWDHEENDADSWRVDGTCSFCGGIKPEKVLELIKSGHTITRTDKNYKIYINGPDVPNGKGMDKVYLQHFNREDIDALNKGIGLI